MARSGRRRKSNQGNQLWSIWEGSVVGGNGCGHRAEIIAPRRSQNLAKFGEKLFKASQIFWAQRSSREHGKNGLSNAVVVEATIL